MDTQESEKIAHKLGETSANHTSYKRLVSRIYKELLQVNNKKTNNSIFLNKQSIYINVSPKKIYSAKLSHEKCSISLVSREMPIKIMRCHFTHTRMVKIKKIDNFVLTRI